MGPVERELLLNAFDSNWIAPLGPHVDAFEQEVATRVGVRAAAALSSGTAGLHLALVLLGVGSGDEVFVSDLTFVASANVVRYVGATPIFVDSDRSTWNMDPDLLAEALADRARRGKPPKCVIVTDLYGQCADYERILAACARYDVPVIQDASESLGATYRGRESGAQGVLAVFSFNGNKILTTSGGGMLVSDRVEWVALARKLASQAREPFAHYEHERVGYNYRLSNLLAALGRGQLRVLNERIEARRRNYRFYQASLGEAGWQFMPEAEYGKATRWLTCATLPAELGYDAEYIREALERQDIEARPIWKPMHLQPVYADCITYGGGTGASLFERGICLPSGSSMSDEDLSKVLDVIVSAIQRARV